LKVPLLDLKLQYAPLREEILAAIARVCDEQRFIMGPEVDGFEAEVAARLGVTHAVGVSSGTDALLLAMMALRIGPGDDVIVPAFSFFATAGCVARLGARPVFVDVDPVTFTMVPDQLQKAVTSRTRAVIPVHLYGLCADMDLIGEIAARAGVPVIEDAAQAIGSTWKGRPAGALGTVGCFSFFPSKNLGAFGDAGLVTTSDAALAARLRLLREHGAQPKYHHREVGGNFRLDALQAAVLRVKLPHLAAWSERRRRNAAVYAELFAASGAAARIRLPVEPRGQTHIYHQYIVRVPDRDGLRAHLASRDIGTEVYYPVPLHRQECFAGEGAAAASCPHAEAAASEVLALPIYPELTRAQQEYVVSSIAERLA
jgi:dTDP-4-amino-4,6-dideoxygalactose transaminase